MWHKISDGVLPETFPDPFGSELSKIVLVVMYGTQHQIAFMRRWDEEDDWKWLTACSNEWDITDKVTHWMPLPPLP